MAQGAVYALIGYGAGDDSRWLYKYNPVANAWGGVDSFDYAIEPGGAMTLGVGDTLCCFRGSGRIWWLYDIGTRETTYYRNDSNRTWYNQYGSSLFSMGGAS